MLHEIYSEAEREWLIENADAVRRISQSGLGQLQILRERIAARRDSRYDAQFIELLDILIAMQEQKP